MRMGVRRSILLAFLAAGLALGLAVPGGARAERVGTPSPGALYHDGPAGRYLLSGRWLLRLDPDDMGRASHWQRQRSTRGWKPIHVPHVWNANDSAAGFAGGIGWYRKDFRLPDRHRGLQWIVRFESVNNRATVWLNGHRLGRHTGAYLPFELRMHALKRHGVNRLVVRVDSRRRPGDFPPGTTNAAGQVTGGFWNYGGLQREVYLRRVQDLDITPIQVRPLLGRRHRAARIAERVVVHNDGRHAQRVTLTGRYGPETVHFAARTIPAGAAKAFTGSVRVRHPHVWAPKHPHLYRATVHARGNRGGRAAYHLQSGIRSITVSHGGHLLLNGKPVHLRGVGLLEDSPKKGAALNNHMRDQLLDAAQKMGATLIRTQYPVHPEIAEQADRRGILLWSEIPVYQMREEYLAKPDVRAAAGRLLARDIQVNQNHPSVLLWSIGNELPGRVGPGQTAYIRQQVKLAHRLDPTRPVALPFASNPLFGCPAAYKSLDVLGVNEYFGWYTRRGGVIADRDGLSPYLDSLRHCYPHQALMVSEFGAGADRDGPPQAKGTYAFQQQFVRYHLGVYATKPWLSGAIYWALREFRVEPGWTGGNPTPEPPIHTKGLIGFAGKPKPAYRTMRKIYRHTRQFNVQLKR